MGHSSLRQGIGRGMIGSRPIAGPWIPTPPTVLELTSPGGSITTGGPGLAVSAPHYQAEDLPTTHVRLVVSNVAESLVFYDSGWLAQIVASEAPIQFHVDLDEIESYHNGENVRFRVYARVTETAGIGEVQRRAGSSAQKSVTVSWGNPQCTITAPVAATVLTTATGLVVSWTFVDAGKTQSAYRVQVRKADSDEVVYSTGWVTSTAVSTALPFIFADGASYDIVVQLKNNHGIRSS